MEPTKKRESFLAQRDALQCSEIIKNRLYFVTFANNRERHNTQDVHYFCIDNDLVYNNFFSDFGPLPIGSLYKFCALLASKLKSPSLSKKAIVHYTNMDQRKRANAAYLIASFAVIYLKMVPREVNRLILCAKHPYLPFQDATIGPSPFRLRIIDCLNAVDKAFFLGFVDFSDFDLNEYEHYERLENGDMNWILPRRFLALSGPSDTPNHAYYHSPEFYLKYFLENDVRTVIRLNKKSYNPSRFSQSGIAHHELYFVDGTTPTQDIVAQFLRICESTPHAIAVHCKAGLGRTGTLIGTYLMKHYNMTALEAIAWLRICRPGSVIGQQQAWLESMEPLMWKMGNSYRVRHHGGSDKIPHHIHGIYSMKQKGDIKNKKEQGGAEKILVNNDNINNKIDGQSSTHVLTASAQSKGKHLIDIILPLKESDHRPSLRARKLSRLNESKVTSQDASTQGDELNKIRWVRYEKGKQKTTNEEKDDQYPSNTN